MKLITDDIKQEGKIFRNLMIIAYSLAIIYPIGCFVSNTIVGISRFSEKDIVAFSIFFIAFGSVELFCWIISMRYKLTVKDESVIIRVLSGQKEIPIESIIGFSYKKSKKELCYFKLYTEEGSHLLITRFKNELLDFLYEKGIEQREPYDHL